ncbi:MAG: hypothetical protein IJY39_13270 [Clostridia bacterium]|nr:hypothetical protein [Clostridia bacterium]
MKRPLRLIALLLALLCLLTAFVACEDSDPETDSRETSAAQPDGSGTTETETETEFFPDVDKQNYGAEFYLNIQTGGTNPKKFYWVEEGEKDAMSEAIYARQTSVYDYLGVEIIGVEAGVYNEYGDKFKTAVKNKDGSVHALQTHVYYSLVSFITENYLIDYNKMPGINLDADYWNRDFMEGLAAGDYLFLGYNDYNLVNTHVITFNKELMAKYEDALDAPVYDLVKNYRWTLAQMISLADMVYVDQTADGKTADDTFGITGNQWVPFCGFLQACDINFVELNEQGEYELSVYNEMNQEKCATLIESLAELTKSNSSWFWYKNEGTEQVPITSGRTLMYMQSTFGLSDNLDYDVDFGVLPFPMFDENQKNVGYRSLEWGGLLVIPNYLEDINMVGETMEMMAFYSDDVTVTFYEKLLGKQVADAPEDKEMLDIIWDSVCSDFGLNYSHMSECFDRIVYMVPNLTHANTEYSLASYVQQQEKGCSKALTGFFKKLELLKNKQ